MLLYNEDNINNRVEIIYNILCKKVENTSMQINYSELKSVHSTMHRDAAIISSTKAPISQKGK